MGTQDRDSVVTLAASVTVRKDIRLIQVSALRVSMGYCGRKKVDLVSKFV
jgi:hypothetical protein